MTTLNIHSYQDFVRSVPLRLGAFLKHIVLQEVPEECATPAQRDSLEWVEQFTSDFTSVLDDLEARITRLESER